MCILSMNNHCGTSLPTSRFPFHLVSCLVQSRQETFTIKESFTSDEAQRRHRPFRSVASLPLFRTGIAHKFTFCPFERYHLFFKGFRRYEYTLFQRHHQTFAGALASSCDPGSFRVQAFTCLLSLTNFRTAPTPTPTTCSPWTSVGA